MKAMLLLASLTLPLIAQAAEPESCATVRFSDVGWTDITVTTAITSEVLESLGYTTRVTLLSIPVTYRALASGKDLDVFLGNWMPTTENDIKPFRDAGTVETVRANLHGAKYTLAVPDYVYDAGLHDFADIAKFKDNLNGQLYGIEPGNDGNRLIQTMIDKNAFGLKDFKLVESSEAAMLSQLKRATRKNEWMVFLGWEPHPMNTRNKMRYLTGGDDYFGPNLGQATVYTNVRKNYLTECSNVGKLLQNLAFSLAMENQLMDAVLNQNQKPRAAAKAWLKAHPDVLQTWLAGVSSRDGRDAMTVASAHLAHP
ncbi:choline ABC transporter substrate-binding protein [Pseudomonas sp. BIGb0164]|jgi:glycine betaine/proline transport system substrate-binding protein|uniref:choline ABC transporter substrate-binding protein n=1 Tax=Pseudomonas sp. BIGb0164 TaxID=2940605 RepID=UPI000EE8CC3A|nr:choline ABC transporter substrate-binding protein [Pseudomonas sp. BIGb0164]MCS4249875.1 glycine betaine/proline transport system substrate-binding protein [Pseudomonas sp. BIGb0164]HCT04992.1 glycine/betaine ABC transporter substrate-binding protein [Pseudomonas sp.]